MTQLTVGERRAPTGRAVMEAIRAGEVEPPPAARLLGLEVLEVGDGTITFGFDAEDRFSNYETTHGGVLAAVCDFAVSTAAWSVLPAESDVRTSNLALTYLRPVPLGARYRCVGEVVHRGRTLVHVVAALLDEGDRPLVRATATCHVRTRR